MAEITEKELKKQIANGMFSPVYLLYGEEAFLKQYYAVKEISVNLLTAIDFFFVLPYNEA